MFGKKNLLLLKHLAENPGWHYGLDLCRTLNLSGGSIYNRLAALEDAGLVEREIEEPQYPVYLPRHRFRALVVKREIPGWLKDSVITLGAADMSPEEYQRKLEEAKKLIAIDPELDSDDGKHLNALVDELVAYERVAFQFDEPTFSGLWRRLTAVFKR